MTERTERVRPQAPRWLSWVPLARGATFFTFLFGVLNAVSGLGFLASLAIAALVGGSMAFKPVRMPYFVPEQPRHPFAQHMAQAMLFFGAFAIIIGAVAGLGPIAGLGFGAFMAVNRLTSKRALGDLIAGSEMKEIEARILKAAEAQAGPKEQPKPAAPVAPDPPVSDDPVVAALLKDSAPARARLVEASAQIVHAPVRAQFEQLLFILGETEKDLIERPERAGATHRLLTYYLPRAAELAETYRTLETRPNLRPQMRSEIEGLLRELENAFRHFADQALVDDFLAMDAEMRVLRANLEQDLKKS